MFDDDPDSVPDGWSVEEPRFFVDSGGCNGEEQTYWSCWGGRVDGPAVTCGFGPTVLAARLDCVGRIEDRLDWGKG